MTLPLGVTDLSVSFNLYGRFANTGISAPSMNMNCGQRQQKYRNLPSIRYIDITIRYIDINIPFDISILTFDSIYRCCCIIIDIIFSIIEWSILVAGQRFYIPLPWWYQTPLQFHKV
jgi:hypothetical protein